MSNTTRIYLSKEQLQKKKQSNKPVFKAPEVENLPKYGSVKQYCPVPYNQSYGDCTANAFCHCYKLLANKNNTSDKHWEPSRLFVYYQERVAENIGVDPSTLQDTGADVVDGETFAQTHGICSEYLYPYSSPIDSTPSQQAMANCSKHKIKSHSLISIDDNLLTNIKKTIISGYPVLLAIAVYASFESSEVAKTGMVPMPTPVNYNDQNDSRDAFMGGHETLIVGYTDVTGSTGNKGLFTVLNSWGAKWGHDGYFYLPYDYVVNPNLGLEFSVISV